MTEIEQLKQMINDLKERVIRLEAKNGIKKTGVKNAYDLSRRRNFK